MPSEYSKKMSEQLSDIMRTWGLLQRLGAFNMTGLCALDGHHDCYEKGLDQIWLLHGDVRPYHDMWMIIS